MVSTSLICILFLYGVLTSVLCWCRLDGAVSSVLRVVCVLVGSLNLMSMVRSALLVLISWKRKCLLCLWKAPNVVCPLVVGPGVVVVVVFADLVRLSVCKLIVCCSLWTKGCVMLWMCVVFLLSASLTLCGPVISVWQCLCGVVSLWLTSVRRCLPVLF